MMKNQDLKNKSTESLEAEIKKIKGVTGVLIGVLILLFAVSLYGLFTKEDNATFIATFAVGISCSAILPIQFINMKRIKAELESRKS